MAGKKGLRAAAWIGWKLFEACDGNGWQEWGCGLVHVVRLLKA
jgi:hypothetical protein